MKIFKVNMLSLKHVEKNWMTKNKLKIKVFIRNHGFWRQTSVGLISLLWQSLLGQRGFLE